MLVGVAYETRNLIPEVFGASEVARFLRYDLDEEMIYTRTHLEFRPEQFADMLKAQKVEAFIYNEMTPELEKALEECGVKAYKGVSGDCKKAVTQLFIKG